MSPPVDPRPPPGPPACPICGKPAAAEETTRPFCSGRCKMVDLGRWFDETYRVPGEEAISLDDLSASPDEE